MPNLRDNELACWLLLAFAPGIGSKRLLRLLNAHPSPVQIVNSPRCAARELRAETSAYLRRPDWARVQQHLSWERSPQHHILRITDPRYPGLLRQIPDPPPLLYVRGDTTLLQRPQVAIVGSRNPTAYGRENAFHLARDLAAQGLVITSGLAQGIDSAAHRGALHCPEGTTVAVIGTGVDRVYPEGNRALAQIIADRGALVSELPLGTAPHPGHFPQRNRIISGLSTGVIVTQATLRSGSLITARLALEQGREVFALPGPVQDPKSQGCHSLLRQGAQLVERSEDVLSEINQYLGDTEVARKTTHDGDDVIPRTICGLNADEHAVLENIDHAPASVDELIHRSGLTPAAVSSILLVLELQGVVEVNNGRYTRLR